PQFLGRRGIQGEDIFRVAPTPREIEPVTDESGAGKANAGLLEGPDERRPRLGPLREQARFRGDAVAAGAGMPWPLRAQHEHQSDKPTWGHPLPLTSSGRRRIRYCPAARSLSGWSCPPWRRPAAIGWAPACPDRRSAVSAR